jgi:hypothetical protein
MDINDSPAEFWLDAQKINIQENLPHSWQDETVKPSKIVEDSICLFGQFVSAVSSDVLKDIQPRSEVS